MDTDGHGRARTRGVRFRKMRKTGGAIHYGGKAIPFHVRYAKRKTMEIAVHADCRVVVKAPLGTGAGHYTEKGRETCALDSAAGGCFPEIRTKNSATTICWRRIASLSRATLSTKNKLRKVRKAYNLAKAYSTLQ